MDQDDKNSLEVIVILNEGVNIFKKTINRFV